MLAAREGSPRLTSTSAPSARRQRRASSACAPTNNVAVAQTIQWTDTIAPSDDQRDLASLVQPGNRAMPLRVSQEDSLSLIRPGDFVDILAVVNGESTVLLQRVLVLASGTIPARIATRTDPTRNANDAKMLTVSVGIAEGQLLALAAERGRLTAVVRKPERSARGGDAPRRWGSPAPRLDKAARALAPATCWTSRAAKLIADQPQRRGARMKRVVSIVALAAVGLAAQPAEAQRAKGGPTTRTALNDAARRDRARGRRVEDDHREGA